jgi:hypothetical protein
VTVETRHNPTIWKVNLKDLISPEHYRRVRWNFFRVHYQFIMANDMPAPYDYVLVVGGPMPIAAWPTRSRDLMAAFLRNAMPDDEPRRREAAINADRV